MENAAIQLHILWGSTLDPHDVPSSYTLASPDEEAAFWKGIEEADGWMDLSEVSSPDWRVDAEGDIVPRKLKTPTKTHPHSRFIIWGEHPEQGARASTYTFDTEGEAEAFSLAASEMVGWTSYSRVPNADYRFVDEAATTAPHLSPVGQLTLAALECGIIDRPEPLFMSPDGAYVSEDWDPSIPPVDFVAAFDKGLRDTYGIGLIDAGVDAELLAKLMRDHEGAPQEAVEWYGNKYDLDPVSNGFSAPSRPKF